MKSKWLFNIYFIYPCIGMSIWPLLITVKYQPKTIIWLNLLGFEPLVSSFKVSCFSVLEKSFSNGFTIYWSGAHFGQWIGRNLSITFLSPDRTKLNLKGSVHRIKGFRGEAVWKCWRWTDGRTNPVYPMNSL